MTVVLLEALRAIALGAVVVFFWCARKKPVVYSLRGALALLAGSLCVLIAVMVGFGGASGSSHAHLTGLGNLISSLETTLTLAGVALVGMGLWHLIPTMSHQSDAAPNSLSRNSIGISAAQQAATERKYAEEAAYREKERAQTTLASIGDGVITTDKAGKIDYMNPAAERLTGWKDAEARGHPLNDVFKIIEEESPPDVGGLVAPGVRQARRKSDVPRLTLVHRAGVHYAIQQTVVPMHDSAGNLVGSVFAFHDITQEQVLKQQVGYQASHDPLTSLVNRQEFETQLQLAIGTARTQSREHAVCYIDLDQFKIVNDTCGHIAGDELLRRLATRLQSTVRTEDCIARLGGDEFGALLFDCPLAQARVIADELHDAIRDFQFSWEGNVFEISASIGLAPVTATSGHFADVLARADSACYLAKDKGRNRIHVIEPDDTEIAQRSADMKWVLRVTQALKENELHLNYQPIHTLRGNGAAPNFCEILVAMREANGNIIPASAFLPAAERYGLMPAVDRWVVGNALLSLGTQGTTLSKGWTCSINLSGQSIGDPDFLDYVVSQLKTTGADPRLICFEITETAAIANFPRARHFISTLHAMGCRFALDDFGSGLSSFAYLKNLTVDYLKISGHFVLGIAGDPIDRAMVQSINQIGHVMGLTTIAESVETDIILEEARRIGVDMVQGYAIARPTSSSIVLPMADTQPVRAATKLEGEPGRIAVPSTGMIPRASRS